MTYYEIRARQLRSTSDEELDSLIDQELVIYKQIRKAEVHFEQAKRNLIQR